jgi:O-antigen ligase
VASDFRRIEWTPVYVGYLAFIFVFTTYRLPIGDVAMAVALLGLLVQKRKIIVPAPMVWLGLWFGWAALSWFFASSGNLLELSGRARFEFTSGVLQADPFTDSRTALIDLGKMWLIVLVAVNALRSASQVRFFVVYFLALFATHPARGTILNYFLGGTHLGRASWINWFGDPNDMAGLTILQLGLAAGLLASERKGLIRIGSIAAVIVLPVVVLFTQSRGGFIGLATFGVFVLWGRVSAKKLVPVAVALMVAMAFAPAGFWQRIGTISQATNVEALSTVEDQGSAEGRWTIWRVSTRIIRDHPITGVGVGAYPWIHWKYADEDPKIIWGARGPKDTHSTYLNVMAETGVLGFLLFVGILVSTLSSAERVRRRVRRVLPRYARQLYFLEAALVAYLVAGIFGSYGRLPFLYVHLAILFAVATIASRGLSQVKQVAQQHAPDHA